MKRLIVFLVASAISLPTTYLNARKKPVTVIPFTDDVGNRFFTYMDKEEYEASDDCPYGKD